MRNSFFERRDDSRPLPIVDDHINNGRLWLLFIYPIVLIISVVLISERLSAGHDWLIFFILSLIPTCLFLGGYWLISGQSPWKLFQHVSLKEWGYTGLLFIAQIIYSIITPKILLVFGDKTVGNPNATALLGSHKWPIFFIQAFNNLFQLMDEEFLGIFIFLAMTAILIQQFHLSRNTAIWGSLFISMIAFGLAHFAVYNWNLPQMLLVIGVARIFMTGSYLHSKSIWTAFVMHYLFDTSGYLIVTMFSSFIPHLH
ncbi:CPBP family glutamic-type intramembrane protease [Furfurilactobacillus curtus]|uniref:CAAX prenyl protease 2/Lysostaphin resistance protein A-like domain-containing protein n=1 Tax=Furfurilactobacillus curtus TaxID=1746200 RepID=A0ABQ5JMX9_9LACO